MNCRACLPSMASALAVLLLWPMVAPAQEPQKEAAEIAAVGEAASEKPASEEKAGESATAGGEDAAEAVEEPEDECEVESIGPVKKVLCKSDRPQRAFANTLEALSRRIDSIYGGDRIYEEAPDTYMQIRGALIYGRGGEFNLEQRVRFKLDLPHTEERFKLILESDTDKGEVLEDRPDTPLPKNAVEAGNFDYTAALEILLRETLKWKISLSPGLRLALPPDPFLRLRLRRSQPLGSRWQSRFTERLSQFVDRGLESRTTLEIERAHEEKNLLRLSLQGLWREEFEENEFQISPAVQFFQRISDLDTIAYEGAVVWETEPNFHHEVYVVDVRWRRRIHKTWLYMEWKPQATFEREKDFHLDPSLTFSLEILFGGRYVK